MFHIIESWPHVKTVSEWLSTRIKAGALIMIKEIGRGYRCKICGRKIYRRWAT